jgi:hypothetical protein
MKSIFKKILFGDVEITEYSTITIDDKIRETVYLGTKNASIDISKNHYVLCLSPVVFGVWFENKDQAEIIAKTDDLKICFYSCSIKRKRNITAIVEVTFTDKIEETARTLLLLKLKSCRIYHANILKRFILFHKYYKKPSLSFQYYKSLISAYSYPRRVRVISFKEDDYYNIFPMDLVGDIQSCNKYVFGLRHTNVTLARVIETKKIVVSEFSFKQKGIIYQLGKHHGSAPPSLASLPFKTILSKQFNFYLPEWVESYKEINITKTMNLGSHMLLWGDVINEEKVATPSRHLYHIHFLQYFHQKTNGFTYTLV